MQIYHDKQKNRQIINARSLSLEVAKHKHRLAAQLVRIHFMHFSIDIFHSKSTTRIILNFLESF